MKINIGTKNEIKISALREVIAGYDFLAEAEVVGVDAGSGVADQPKSFEETIRGAKNRAQNAFNDDKMRLGDLAVGIEDGLMAVPESLTGFMNVCVCAFYDGGRYYLGLSPAFEYSPRVVDLVNKGMDINQAYYSLGLTDDEKIGSSQGAIGLLTKGRWCRKEMVKLAIIAALIQLDNKDLY
jgi:inosine/xanthosine triphosphatase